MARAWSKPREKILRRDTDADREVALEAPANRAWPVVLLVPRPARQEVGDVRQQPDEGGEAAPDALRAAGEIDDQARAEEAGPSSGEGRERRLGEAPGAKVLGDALGLALDHVEGGLGSHVAGGEAGAAGRDHE